MLFSADAPGPHFLNNCKKDLVHNLPGLHYEAADGILTTRRDFKTTSSRQTTSPVLEKSHFHWQAIHRQV